MTAQGEALGGEFQIVGLALKGRAWAALLVNLGAPLQGY